MKLVNVVADSRNQLPRLVLGLPKPYRDDSNWTRASLDKSEGTTGLPTPSQYHDVHFQEIPSTHLLLTTLMASRRLALNLSQGLRGRAGLNAVAPLRRGFATPVVKNGVKTESTTLSNGLTVNSQCSSAMGHLLMRDRSLQSIRPGPRPRQLVFGSMLDLGRRRIRPMAQLISSSISHSRFASTEGIYTASAAD
jgi:hypothetical protein